MSARSEALAARLEANATALAEFARGLSAADWATPVPHDLRSVGTVVHHVASVYPIEIQLAQLLASGKPMEGVTMNAVHEMNAGHNTENPRPDQTETIAFLLASAKTAADAIRAMSDADLDSVQPASLYDGVPISCQFMLEDHAVRHSHHHLVVIKRALGR
jgi:hypothetical protein